MGNNNEKLNFDIIYLYCRHNIKYLVTFEIPLIQLPSAEDSPILVSNGIRINPTITTSQSDIDLFRRGSASSTGSGQSEGNKVKGKGKGGNKTNGGLSSSPVKKRKSSKVRRRKAGGSVSEMDLQDMQDSDQVIIINTVYTQSRVNYYSIISIFY